jgi:hypothetical protein
MVASARTLSLPPLQAGKRPMVASRSAAVFWFRLVPDAGKLLSSIVLASRPTASLLVISITANKIFLHSIFLPNFFITDRFEMVSLGFQDSRTTQAIIVMIRHAVALYAVRWTMLENCKRTAAVGF